MEHHKIATVGELKQGLFVLGTHIRVYGIFSWKNGVIGGKQAFVAGNGNKLTLLLNQCCGSSWQEGEPYYFFGTLLSCRQDDLCLQVSLSRSAKGLDVNLFVQSLDIARKYVIPST